MESYPDYYPSDFPKRIREAGARYQELQVYRLACYGAEDPNSYRTSIDERIHQGWIKINRDGKPYNIPNSMRELDLDDIDSYSMSCNYSIAIMKQACKTWARRYPKPEIVKGKTVIDYGLTRETDHSHVSWYLFKDADVRLCFQRVNEVEI